MSGSEQEFGGAIPDRYHNFIATEQRVKGFVEESGKTEIANFYLATRGYHDICWLEISMQNPIGMQVLTSIQELKHDALDSCWRDRVPSRLRMVMNDLEEVMLSIFEHHEDTFTLQDNFHKSDDIYMTQLGAQGHLSYGGLGYSRVLDLFALLVFDL